MATISTSVNYTPDDLLKMPDGDNYELVNGNLVERNVSLWSSYVAGELHGLLRAFCRENRLGWVLPEGTSYCCFPDDPDRVRRPDVSFICWERLSPEQAETEGHVSVVPDLAVEVISPNDRVYEVEEKAAEWLAAGVRLLWIVHPRAREVQVRRPQGPIVNLKESDELSGDEVILDFRCRVGDLFQLPPKPKDREASP
jgi:Uma2 family endonuclease